MYRRPVETLLTEALSVIGYARQTLRLHPGSEERVAGHLSSEYLRLLEGLRKLQAPLGVVLAKAQSTPMATRKHGGPSLAIHQTFL